MFCPKTLIIYALKLMFFCILKSILFLCQLFLCLKSFYVWGVFVSWEFIRTCLRSFCVWGFLISDNKINVWFQTSIIYSMNSRFNLKRWSLMLIIQRFIKNVDHLCLSIQRVIWNVDHLCLPIQCSRNVYSRPLRQGPAPEDTQRLFRC